MCSENQQRQNQLPNNPTTMANTDLVLCNFGTFNRFSVDSSTQTEATSSPGDGQNTSIDKSDDVDSMSFMRRSYESRGIFEKSYKKIMSSWRRSTQKQYTTFIRRWCFFCHKRKINSILPALTDVLDFLTELYDQGLSYSAINSARSSLSAFGIQCNGIAVGSNVTIMSS